MAQICRHAPSEEELSKLMKELDANNDNQVSFEEFLYLLQRFKKKGNIAGAGNQFSSLIGGMVDAAPDNFDAQELAVYQKQDDHLNLRDFANHVHQAVSDKRSSIKIKSAFTDAIFRQQQACDLDNFSSQDDESCEFRERNENLLSFDRREQFMAESLLFRNFTLGMRHKLIGSFVVKEANIGDVLMREGQMVNGFIVICEGVATITHLVE